MRTWATLDTAPNPNPVPGALFAYDTAAGAITQVGPAAGQTRPATMYVCGITPYDATHIGHAFTYLTFDLVNRVWRDLGLNVIYAQNVTDVDDPLLERAALTGRDWKQLAASEIDIFRSDMAALGILPPHHWVSVTESLPWIEDDLIRSRDSSLIYPISGSEADWYFPCSTRPGFGAVSHLSRDEMLASFGEHGGDPDRVGKQDRLDALVWRQARPGEPWWPSDLGPGRPGWHIECASIATRVLGGTIDLQGGGRDLIFPHHEMCAAHATALTAEPFASAFVHSAMVWLDGEKMSKSKGNLVKVADLRGAGHPPMAIRLALLAHHYRDDWEWTGADLDGATHRHAQWLAALSGSTSIDATSTISQVRAALRADLHADLGLLMIDQWARASMKASGDHPGSRQAMADIITRLLGVDTGVDRLVR